MRIRFFPVLLGIFMPFAAIPAQEGVPIYYKGATGGDSLATATYKPGATSSSYVGQNSQKQVVATRTYSYQVPAPVAPVVTGTMTPAGIAINPADEPPFVLSADYARRYAKFQFETGVQSILGWNDMIFNEIGVQGQYKFSLRNVDMFAFGEYRYGTLGTGGLSMDYDLKPYDNKYPTYGIFTISMGDESGKTNYLRVGLGARHVWDLGGWKLSPSIGYEMFNHDLVMSDHIYPNPAIYLPLLNQFGDYIYGDENGKYYSVPQGVTPPDGTFQVCLSPEDIKVAIANPDHTPQLTPDGLGNLVLVTGDYQYIWGTLPWGVGPGECVIIGGDGPIVVPGTTHIYNTRWSGLFLGLEVEKQMTFSDKLRFYAQIGIPNYYSEGTWPMRTDWQQNPSFIDQGSNGSYSYQAEMEYIYTMSNRLQLSLKASTNYYYVGKISGDLFVAAYTTWLRDANGQYVLDANGYPILQTIEAHTEHISESLRYAYWQSFALHLGLKYAF
ncbi:MAG: hypothetical protein FWC61_03500 [Proteobacteria bacterium]|nr:hypothetical protein [Pseudomonadota bacterium]